MKTSLVIFISLALTVAQVQAQVEPNAGNWKTWFITSGKDYRLSPPSSYKNEIAQVISAQPY